MLGSKLFWIMTVWHGYLHIGDVFSLTLTNNPQIWAVPYKLNEHLHNALVLLLICETRASVHANRWQHVRMTGVNMWYGLEEFWRILERNIWIRYLKCLSSVDLGMRMTLFEMGGLPSSVVIRMKHLDMGELLTEMLMLSVPYFTRTTTSIITPAYIWTWYWI